MADKSPLALESLEKFEAGAITAAELVRTLRECAWDGELATPIATATARCTTDAERLEIFDFLLSKPVPKRRPGWGRLNYLRALNQACVLAARVGDKRRAAGIADLGVGHIRENPFIAHSAACAYVAVERFDDAIKCVRLAVKYEYRHLGSLRVDEELTPLRDLPGFPKLKPADRARYEDLEAATPDTLLAVLRRGRARLWEVRPRWSEHEWARLYAATLPHLGSVDPGCEQASWELVSDALNYGPEVVRREDGHARVFAMLRPALEAMFGRAPARLEKFAHDTGVALLELPALKEWLGTLPRAPGAAPDTASWTRCALITIRRRTGAFSSLADFLPYLEATDARIRATAAEEIAHACSGGFLSAAAAPLDAATLEAVTRSEEERPGILWPFLGHFWRTNALEVIAVAAGKDARDWVFELLARSPASWVYEEFFNRPDDLIRLLRLGRDHDAHLAALEHGLDLEEARRAALTGDSAPP